jgi:hypothetical protein
MKYMIAHQASSPDCIIPAWEEVDKNETFD